MKSKGNGVGKEGLKYTDPAGVAGGPIDGEAKGGGLGAGYEVKGGKSIPPVVKGKGGPKK